MKNRLLYPCVVREEDGVFYANFVNFEGCFTDGETLEEVVRNAKDVLSGMLFTMAKNNISFPKSENSEIKLENGEFLIYVDVWISPILEKARNQAVKKTLTIPAWLNQRALDKGINFSKVLQEALVAKTV